MLGLGIDAQVDKWEFNAGDCWTEKIYSMIGQADAVVVVLSKNSINAEWVREEINAALVQRVKRGMGLLPVILDGLKIADIPQALHHIQWVRVNAGDSAGAADQINRAIRGIRNPWKPQLLAPNPNQSRAVLSPDGPMSKWPLEKLQEVIAEGTRAQAELGLRHYHGRGVPQDKTEAAKWLHHAAEQGDAGAQNNLGNRYAKGEGVLQDYAESAKWLRRAAEQGLAQAQYNFGLSHLRNEGVPQDDEKAAEWFGLAAEQGLAQAQHDLGCFYHDGKGVSQDHAKAVEWFRRAAEQGLVQSQVVLGAAYDKGKGVPQDKAEAAKWYRRAAEQGDAVAQHNIGAAYHNGQGVPQDRREAFIWVVLAATNGDKDAAEAWNHLAKELSPADLSAAKAEAIRRHAEIQRKRGK